MSEEIRLIKFTVELERWGSNEGKYTCAAQFKQGKNNFSITLENELGAALVEKCKSEIAKAGEAAIEGLVLIARGEA